MANKKYYVYLNIEGQNENSSKIIRYNNKEEKYATILMVLTDFFILKGPIERFTITFEEDYDG